VSKIPVKTRLPREAWVVAALVALVSTLSPLVGGTADSVATNMPSPIERSSHVVKAVLVGDHRTRSGIDLQVE
jgi:hypothetical protein